MWRRNNDNMETTTILIDNFSHNTPNNLVSYLTNVFSSKLKLVESSMQDSLFVNLIFNS